VYRLAEPGPNQPSNPSLQTEQCGGDAPFQQGIGKRACRMSSLSCGPLFELAPGDLLLGALPVRPWGDIHNVLTSFLG